MATFFTWLRAIDVTQPGNEPKFRTSWTVTVAPLLKIGREILFVPYSRQAGLAYVDLVFGDRFVSFWVFVPLIRHLRTRERGQGEGMAERAFVLLVFMGCASWLTSALENIVGLAWGPFYPTYTVFCNCTAFLSRR